MDQEENFHISTKHTVSTTQPVYNTVVGIQAEPVLVEQPCCMQTKMYRIYRNRTVNFHFIRLFKHLFLFIFRTYCISKHVEQCDKEVCVYLGLFLLLNYVLNGYLHMDTKMVILLER